VYQQGLRPGQNLGGGWTLRGKIWGLPPTHLVRAATSGGSYYQKVWGVRLCGSESGGGGEFSKITPPPTPVSVVYLFNIISFVRENVICLIFFSSVGEYILFKYYIISSVGYI